MYKKILGNFYFRALLLILLIGTVWFLVTTDWEEKDYTRLLRSWYEYDTKQALNIGEQHWFLDDILKATRQPQLGRTIFFHVTNCLKLHMDLTDRQACTIESAAKLNPKWDVFVLFASPVAFSLHLSKALQRLIFYPNIHWRNVDFWAYGQDTPVQEWILDKNQLLLKSTYFFTHLSDYLRLVSLFRYGGTHMDLDFIMIKSISSLEPNYACAETETSVNNAVMNFDPIGLGHEIVKNCLRTTRSCMNFTAAMPQRTERIGAKLYLQNFAQYFDGEGWAENGPVVITRELQRLCNTYNTTEMSRKRCNFEILPEKTFYPITWLQRETLFQHNYTFEVALMTKESLAVHFWNSATSGYQIRIDPAKPTAYEMFANEFCPLVYNSLDIFF